LDIGGLCSVFRGIDTPDLVIRTRVVLLVSVAAVSSVTHKCHFDIDVETSQNFAPAVRMQYCTTHLCAFYVVTKYCSHCTA